MIDPGTRESRRFRHNRDASLGPGTLWAEWYQWPMSCDLGEKEVRVLSHRLSRICRDVHIVI